MKKCRNSGFQLKNINIQDTEAELTCIKKGHIGITY